MATDIQQDDLLLRNDDSQCDAIAIGDADGLNAFELAAKVIVFQVGLERVALQIAEDTGELCPYSPWCLVNFLAARVNRAVQTNRYIHISLPIQAL